MWSINSSSLRRGELLAALFAGAWRSVISPAPLTASQLASILPLLVDGRMAGLGWRRVRGGPLADSDEGSALQAARRVQAAESSRQERAVEAVLALEEVDRADPILIKGWAAGQLYPEPGLRPYTDVDLLVRPEVYERIIQGLPRLMQADPTWSFAIDVQKEWRDLPYRTWEELHARSRFVPLRGRQVRILSPEDSLRLSCLHFLRHGGSKPAWLCDIAALLDNLPSGFDWAYCFMGGQRESGWMISVMQLASDLLGATMPPAARERVVAPTPRWMRRAVLRRWGNPATYQPERVLPIPTIIKTNLSGLPRAFIDRWRNPVESVFRLRWPIRKYLGPSAQVVDYAARGLTWPRRQLGSGRSRWSAAR